MQRYPLRIIAFSLVIGTMIAWGNLRARAVDSKEQQITSSQAMPVAPQPATGSNSMLSVSPPSEPIPMGVINDKAISKPQPSYPPIAMANPLPQGIVGVQVIVDKTGKVISAHATSGHPLLQQAAVRAAKQARFSPTQLSGQPVRITGLLTYDFVPPNQHKPRSRRRH